MLSQFHPKLFLLSKIDYGKLEQLDLDPNKIVKNGMGFMFFKLVCFMGMFPRMDPTMDIWTLS